MSTNRPRRPQPNTCSSCVHASFDKTATGLVKRHGVRCRWTLEDQLPDVSIAYSLTLQFQTFVHPDMGANCPTYTPSPLDSPRLAAQSMTHPASEPSPPNKEPGQ